MRVSYWFLLWLSVVGPLWAKPPVVELTPATTSLLVWNRAELLEDPTCRLPLQSVLSLQRPLAFSSTAGRSTQLGFSPSDFWLRFRVRTDDTITHRS